MDGRLITLARGTPGFLRDREGMALYAAGLLGAKTGPLLEIGSYCGKSAIYLGAAAREQGTVLYSIDHHRGSEEHQVGEEYHDPRLVNPATGMIDSFPRFRATIADAGLETVVVLIVATSATVAAGWATPLGLVFIDGGHSEAAARTDYESWSVHVTAGGLLVIHDVFEDPGEGGRAPYLVYREALDSGRFIELDGEGSLRVLQRIDNGGL